MEPLPAPATRNIFYSQGNISSHPTNTTAAAAAKNPCLFLFCITFNICGTRALRSDTCVRARWRCYREIPPPPKYLQATAGAGVSVSGAKVCRSRSWLHLRPQLLGYRSLCTTSQRHLVSGGRGISQHDTCPRHWTRLKLNVKVLILFPIHCGDNLVIQGCVGCSGHKFSGFDGNQLVMAGVQTNIK